MLDKEILDGFKEETNQLMEELLEVVEKLEIRSTTFPGELIEQFAQRIDRVMGAAKTMSQMDPDSTGLIRVGKIAEICKRMGYMAAGMKSPKLIPLFAAFWAETVEAIQELINALGDEVKTEQLLKSQSKVVQGRLEWLSKQVTAMAPNASATLRGAGPTVDQMAVDALTGDAAVSAQEDTESDLDTANFADLMKDLELD